ncbi:MFS transporter [Egibacter rhizosphaerae]|uniref:MFS transporter n=1 Tax=Egibacter rhizosphaerae TaxID=1670831 RepID=A0A411YHW4_9ACTN|nr:MFS transporter [Egibacter rhizosphaerae]QBI20925.1 MFS transporter [Egibacter rhizosphaerae]
MPASSARPSVVWIFAVTATAVSTNTLIAPSLPEITAALDAPRSAAGLLIGAGTLPGIALAPIIGVLADRRGRRRVLVPCLVIFGVTGGLGALAPDFPTLVGLRLLQGIGSAGLMNLAIVLIGDHWEGPSRSRMIGRNAAVLTVCLSIFPLIGGTLAEVFSWQAPFLLYPVGLLTAAAIRLRLPADQPQTDANLGRQLRGVKPLLTAGPLVTILASGGVLFAVIFGLLVTVLPLYLESAFGVGETLRGVVLGIPAIANMATSLSLGRLRARFAPRALFVAGSALLTIGLGSVPLMPTWVGVIGAISVFGLGEGILLPLLQDLATSLGEAAQRGTIVALFVSIARLGQTVGPVASGAVVTGVGEPAAFAGGAVVTLILGTSLAVIGRRL